MKKHIKPAFHLAVGAVLAIMFAQQKPVNAPPPTVKEQWENIANENKSEAIRQLQHNEFEQRKIAILRWELAKNAKEPEDIEDRLKMTAEYFDALNKINAARKGLALLDAEPRPPTAEEKTLIGTGQFTGLQVIPTFKKEDAINYPDTPATAGVISRINADVSKVRRNEAEEAKEKAGEEEDKGGEEKAKAAEEKAKAGEEEDKSTDDKEGEEKSDEPAPAAEASEAPAPAAEAPEAPEPAAEASEAPEPAAEASEAPEPAAEASEAPEPQEAPDPGIQINQ